MADEGPRPLQNLHGQHAILRRTYQTALGQYGEDPRTHDALRDLEDFQRKHGHKLSLPEPNAKSLAKIQKTFEP